MAKTNITEYSATPSSNTDINSINIDENCPASGLNNAIRELMAHLKNVDTGSQALTALSVAGSVTATTSLKTPLIEFTDGDNALTIADGGNVTANADLTVSGAFTSQGIDDNADATAITITSAEEIGIGTSSPTSSSGGKLLAIETSADEHTNVVFNTANVGKSGILEGRRTGRSGVERFAQINLQNNADKGELRFYTAPSGSDISERLRLDSDGNLLLNTTSSTGFKMDINANGGSALFTQNIGSGTIGVLTRPSGNHNYIGMRFDNSSASIVGTISVGTGSTSYNTTSDHRVKENVEDMTGAIDRLKQLSPKRFNFIADDTNTLVDGFLAHEAQSVVAEAVTGTHNEVDDDGNAVMQGIDQAKLVPLLTGALKEAIAKIEALETKVTALENA